MFELIYSDNGIKRDENKIVKESKDNVFWIDISNITEKEALLIGEQFSLHPLTVEDLQTINSRIKVEEFQDYLFCVFYAINKNKNNVRLNEIDFVIGKNFVITNHKEKIEYYEILKKNEKKLEDLLKKGSDFLFHKLLDKVIDNYFPNLEELDDQLEDIEEQIIKKPQPKHLAKILEFKKNARQIKKIGFQLRDKVSFLAKNDYALISKKSVPYFRDVYDHAIRVSDSIDNYREAISETFDAYMSALNNNMNEVMKVLSIFATIALPMTVISGIYGTNFLNLPGSKVSYGFWIMISVMFLFSVSMIVFFKKRGWF